MIYESIHHSYGISTDTGTIQFEPNGEIIDRKGGRKTALGEVDTSSEYVQARLKLKDKEIQHAIEACPAFRRGRAGVQGVWRKADRLSAIERETMTIRLADSMKVLDEDMLRHFIARNGQKVAMDATKETLVVQATKIALQKQGIEAAEEATAPAPTPPVKAKKSKTEVLTT